MMAVNCAHRISLHSTMPQRAQEVRLTRVNAGKKTNLTCENQDSDDQVLSRVQSGEVNAYRQIVEKYQQRVHSVAFGILGNFQDAEDVAQEAFVKAYRSLDSFRGQSSFYTWLYRIVFNLSIDLQRKRYRKVESSVGDATAVEVATQHPRNLGLSSQLVGTSPHDLLERKELHHKIQEALSSLSPDHRAVITLREIDGLSYHEISEVVGCSRGTVMSRLHHARKRLQQYLLEYFPPIEHLGRGQNAENVSLEIVK